MARLLIVVIFVCLQRPTFFWFLQPDSVWVSCVAPNPIRLMWPYSLALASILAGSSGTRNRIRNGARMKDYPVASFLSPLKCPSRWQYILVQPLIWWAFALFVCFRVCVFLASTWLFVIPFGDCAPLQIAVDGRHYCEYFHRVPYTLADTLQIQGDVRVSMIDFQSSHMYPPQPNINRLNVVNPVSIKLSIHYVAMWYWQPFLLLSLCSLYRSSLPSMETFLSVARSKFMEEWNPNLTGTPSNICFVVWRI